MPESSSSANRTTASLSAQSGASPAASIEPLPPTPPNAASYTQLPSPSQPSSSSQQAAGSSAAVKQLQQQQNAHVNEKPTTKKKQLGNWLFKKFGGSHTHGYARHHHTSSLDSQQQQQQLASAEADSANGAAPLIAQAYRQQQNGGPVPPPAPAPANPSSLRNRRPSFPRSRKSATAAVQTTEAPNGKAANGGTPAGPSTGRRILGSGVALGRPTSADSQLNRHASGGFGGGGGVSSFWRAAQLDGVPSPSRTSKPNAQNATVASQLAAPNGVSQAGSSPHLTTSANAVPLSNARTGPQPTNSSPMLTDGLANTLFIPNDQSALPPPALQASPPLNVDGTSAPPRLLDPIPPISTTSLEDPLHLGPALVRSGEADDDDEDQSIRGARMGPGDRTGASSPARSQTAYSIGTTSLGTDTSAPASSINSLVRIRGGADLRNTGIISGGMVGGVVAGIDLGTSSNGHVNGLGRPSQSRYDDDILDIPDGGSTERHSTDSGSSEASERAWRRRRRYSGDEDTMDTGKSVSTKPTTVMSLDTRDASGAPMAHIAQYRHGDPTSPSFGPQQGASHQFTPGTASGSMRNSQQLTASGSASISFAPTHHLMRSTSAGTSGASPLGPGPSGSGVPGANQGVEDAGPFVNVPTFSRPHPSNNPAPQGYPADNASMLTLASSTAAQSILGPTVGGPPPSIRTHGRAPSVATRSLGGRSFGMGERRNSSDTYASLKALPPLSRRGSDASARTGLESVAEPMSAISPSPGPSSAALGGGTAGLGGGAPVSAVPGTTMPGGPGAPLDRVGSLHRSPSMRTVNTQLSVPFSLAAVYEGTMASASLTRASVMGIGTSGSYQHHSSSSPHPQNGVSGGSNGGPVPGSESGDGIVGETGAGLPSTDSAGGSHVDSIVP
ncbi:hypothetical protein OC846_000812 [Tilletia horrida]|uniref:Uncharacterized protein n=1 Tax=Tilletia horrida TaxID=155126 RepID=A0AAN6GWE9_9BASI|nr:hypothetical protein OC846_000812 [Tilletia horrida]KAK0566662.1 hypothetical protein OC861_003102 [Tilletia horrida]